MTTTNAAAAVVRQEWQSFFGFVWFYIYRVRGALLSTDAADGWTVSEEATFQCVESGHSLRHDATQEGLDE